MYHTDLLKNFPITSDQITLQELTVVLRELEGVLQDNVEGAVVEFGCYSGTTSLFIRRMLDKLASDRAFQVYDSFAGLPSKAVQDQNAAGIDFAAGELTVSKKQFLKNFERAKLRPPVVHKAWFDQLSAQEVPSPIAFAFLDGDFYNSILTSLQLVWPRLSSRATVVVHDYNRETLPGVARAINDYFAKQKLSLRVRAEANIAILKA
jgi:O-methyltransferase